jgi:DNA replication protein DnaC
MEQTIETATCRDCGASFPAAVATMQILGSSLTLRENYCPSCITQKEANLAAFTKGERPASRPRWTEICDAAYLGFEMDLLPAESQRFARKVFEWQDSPRGIGLAGPSRIGKTFVLTELFRRHYEYGKSVLMILATDFAYTMGDPDQTQRRRMIDQCLAADLLFIDDIAKPKMTDRVEADLFRVIEKRKRNLKPVFVTLNGSGKTLAEMLSAEGGNALVNRLRHDVCEFVRIDKPANS